MKKKSQERKMIFQDDAIYKSILTNLPEILKNVTKLKEAYEKLELSQDFDDEVFKQLISFGTEKVEKMYNDSLNASLDAMGAVNGVIRANLLSNTETCLIGLKSTLNVLRYSGRANASGDTFPINAVSIIDGLPKVTEDDLEKIRENFCRIYIETDIEHLVYDSIKNLERSYNAMLKVFETTGYRDYFGLDTLQYLLSEDEITKVVKIKPGAVAYAVNYDLDYKMARRRN